MVFEIYCSPFTVNSRKVLAGLELMGTEYNFNHVDWVAGEHRSDAYKKISDSATLPSAIDGEVKIFESNAILMYAADRDGKYTVYPRDLAKRARVNSWLLWESSVWFSTTYKYLNEYAIKPLRGGTPDAAVIAEAEPLFHRYAAMLEQQLSVTKWLVGEECTIADIAVASCIQAHIKQNLPWADYPRLQTWMKEYIEGLPAWQRTQGAVDKALSIKASGLQK